MTARRVHWSTQPEVEEVAFASGQELGVGHDHAGDYEFVVTREGTEYRARLAATGRVAS